MWLANSGQIGSVANLGLGVVFSAKESHYVRKKLVCRVAGSFAADSGKDSLDSALPVCRARNPPSIGEYIVPHITCHARICEVQLTIAPIGTKGLVDDIYYSLLKRLALCTEIAWVFPPRAPTLASMAFPVDTPVSRIP